MASSSPFLELETGFAGTVRESLNAAMVQMTTTVEDDFGNPSLDCALADKLADLFRAFLVAAVLASGLELGIEGRSADDASWTSYRLSSMTWA